MSGETEAHPSGWTVDTALSYMQKQHDDLRDTLDERYATQVKALDAALVAQQTAMQTAFTAADKAVQAALESAEKAVSKAEVAAEKRFEAVNEFRGQLADQAATLMARSEAEVRFAALTQRISLEVERAAERSADGATRTDVRITELTRRMDLSTGKENGGNARDAKTFSVIGAVGGVIGIALGLVALIAVFGK
jgi:hypothetical protein